MEIPPCFTLLTPLQNVENLKPFHPSPPEVGPSQEAPPPELVEGEEEFELEDILAHHLVGPHKRPEFLVSFKGYGPEDDLWLPQHNLEHAQDILRAYQARQTNDLSRPARPSRAQRAPQALLHMGHVFYPLCSHKGLCLNQEGRNVRLPAHSWHQGPCVPRPSPLFTRLSPFFKFTSPLQPNPQA